jgi:hypothetical protein
VAFFSFFLGIFLLMQETFQDKLFDLLEIIYTFYFSHDFLVFREIDKRWYIGDAKIMNVAL